MHITIVENRSACDPNNPPKCDPLNPVKNSPGYIPARAKYTYTADTSGFVSPVYTWYERFCDYRDTGCESWVTITGLGSTFNRVLGKDCTGSGQKTFHVQVQVHNADGHELTDQMTTSLCELAKPANEKGRRGGGHLSPPRSGQSQGRRRSREKRLSHLVFDNRFATCFRPSGWRCATCRR